MTKLTELRRGKVSLRSGEGFVGRDNFGNSPQACTAACPNIGDVGGCKAVAINHGEKIRGSSTAPRQARLAQNDNF